jgi:tetratricopeptide (TPR) repeat protein
MNVPGYLASSFRYDEAGLVNGAGRKVERPSPYYFWHRLLNTSMARMKHDYITGLCLYSVGSEAHYKRGFLMDILGYHDLAILEYSLAIEIDPDNDRYYNNRGSLYLLGNKPYRAVLDFTHAIAINPNRPEAYYNRGRALEKMGKYDEAHRDYEKAVDLGICDKLPSLKICK